MPRNGVHPHKKFEGIYLIGGEGEERLGTRSLAPGENVYGEEIVKVGDEEYRIWDPFRSKLAAAILKGLHKIPIREKLKVFFFQAEDGIRVATVTGVQTCALPICRNRERGEVRARNPWAAENRNRRSRRSEERRVGKECRSRGWTAHANKRKLAIAARMDAFGGSNEGDKVRTALEKKLRTRTDRYT